jgi:nitrogen regulatory protein P-II 1
MKMIRLIAPPSQLDAIREHLIVAGVDGVTIMKCRSADGRPPLQDGDQQDLQAGILFEIVVPDAEVSKIVDALVCPTGSGNDRQSKISLSQIDAVYSIGQTDRSEPEFG